MGAFIIDENGNYVPVFGSIDVVEQTFEATTTLNAASTDGQVPTAKTVYDFVNTEITASVPVFEQYGTITIDI